MKLYVVMHDCTTSWRGIAEWMGSTIEDGCRVFLRKKDALDRCKGTHYRVVTFETLDKGRDARQN